MPMPPRKNAAPVFRGMADFLTLRFSLVAKEGHVTNGR